MRIGKLLPHTFEPLDLGRGDLFFPAGALAFALDAGQIGIRLGNLIANAGGFAEQPRE